MTAGSRLDAMPDWGNLQDSIRRLSAKPWRAVEAQHQVITRKLVRSLDEQILLESMLENVKPPLDPETGAGLHYLLSTPFRYPPLKHGSRFGTQTQRGIWYGSARVKTVFAEVAHYRVLFIRHTTAELGPVYLDYTVFRAAVRTSRGIDLTRRPFLQYKAMLVDLEDYSQTQALGARMREESVQAFRCFSARDHDNGINIALFTAAAFEKKIPLEYQRWHTVTTAEKVEFRSLDQPGTQTFVITPGNKPGAGR